MGATFVVVPQWQGSGSSRALQLRDGADAIRDDLPASATVSITVPLGAGNAEDSGVQRLSALRLIRDETLAVLADIDDAVITIGGDSGVELASMTHAMRRRDGDVALIWLGAHTDLHTPETSPSGAFHGMVLRTLLGDGVEALVPETPLSPNRVVLAGTRAIDDAEAAYLGSAGIRLLTPGELTPAALVEAVEATGAASVYLHIDLDVLDPSEFDGLAYPEPFGLSLTTLLSLITDVRSRFPLAGAGITEFAPATPEAAASDLSSILRIIAALTHRSAP